MRHPIHRTSALALALLLPGPALAQATVYRDANGVPHVVADTEEEVWYALGFENGRDGLYAAQVNLKKYTGQWAKFMADPSDPATLADVKYRNDFIAALFQVDPRVRFQGSQDLEADTAAMLGDQQLFDDLEAYAQGLDDYRARIQAGTGLTAQEQAMRNWLDSTGFAWVYTEPITVFDVAAYGPYQKALPSFGVCEVDDPTAFPVAASSAAGGGRPDEAPDAMAQVKAMLAGQPGSGSNSFAWTYGFTDPAEPHTAHLADAHGGLQTDFVYPGGSTPEGATSSRFFAHAVVEDPTSPMDVFGYMFHGSGMFFAFHNQDFAVGGSASNSNPSDSFLLRLRPADTSGGNASGPPYVDPTNGTYSYYSYYSDANQDEGVDGNDWIELPVVSIGFEGPSGPVSFEVLDAGPFGVVLNATPLAVPNTKFWHVGGQGKNTIGPLGSNHVYDPDPDEGTIPCLVAYRMPGLPGVDDRNWAPGTALHDRPKQAHHDRFATGEYRLLRAESVLDFQAELALLDTTYVVNVCSADRDGRVFNTKSAAMPVRGDDSLLPGLFPAGLVNKALAPVDKFFLYRKFNGDKEPVPARWSHDVVWDWPLDGAGRVRYLVPNGTGGAGDDDYLPYYLHDPVGGQDHPTPVPYDPLDPEAYENPGFATSSNDEIFYANKKSGDPLVNAVFGLTVNAGTLYSSMFLNAGILRKNDFFVDRLLRILEGTDPLLTRDDSKKLALDCRSLVHRDYPGYKLDSSTTVLEPGVQDLPVPVRALREMAGPPGDTATIDAIRAEAVRELAFFADLWGALHGTLPGGQDWRFYVDPASGAQLNLKTAWVKGGFGQGFDRWMPYYPSGSLVALYAPLGFGLVDFLWSEIRLGSAKVAPADAGLSDADRDRFKALVQELEAWGADDFQNATDSEPALLLELYRLGFLASTNGYAGCGSNTLVADAKFEEGRIWYPVYLGKGATLPDRFPSCIDDEDFLDLLDLFSLDSGVKAGDEALAVYDLATGQYVGGPRQGQQALVYTQSYEPFLDWLWGTNANASLMAEFGSQKIVNRPLPPYAALYTQGGTGPVKQASEVTPQDVVDITEFFLEALGGFDIYFDAVDNRWETEKLDVFLLWPNEPVTGDFPYPNAYPLTRNLMRLFFVRRLLDADDFRQAKFAPGATWGDLVQSRAFALDGTQVFPPGGGGVPASGPGLRALARGADFAGDFSAAALSAAEAKGFQTRLWAMGGSSTPVVTIFPVNAPNEPARSFFWSTPGQRTSAFTSPHAGDLTGASASGTPVPTYVADYTGHLSTDPEFPQNPYTVP